MKTTTKFLITWANPADGSYYHDVFDIELNGDTVTSPGEAMDAAIGFLIDNYPNLTVEDLNSVEFLGFYDYED